MERVFVSHSHADNRMVATFVRDLWDAGVDVWVDLQDIAHGIFQERIDEALKECIWFVLIMTPQSLASPWVRRETYAADTRVLNKHMRDIIPFVGSAFDEQLVQPLQGGYHRYDALKDGYTAAFQGLLKAIGKTVVIPLSIRELGHDVKGIPEASDAIIQEVKLRTMRQAPGQQSPAQTTPSFSSPITMARQQAQEVHDAVSNSRWRTAVTIAEDAVQKPENQQDATLWSDYAVALIKIGDRKKGMDMLAKAMQNAPDRADLWRLRAQMLAEDGDLTNAIAAWKMAFTRSTSTEQRLPILAEQYQAQIKGKDLAGAHQTCQFAEELAPTSHEWQQRATELEVLKLQLEYERLASTQQWDAAIAIIDRILQIVPNDANWTRLKQQILAQKEAQRKQIEEAQRKQLEEAQRKQREEEQRKQAERIARLLPTSLQTKGFTVQAYNGVDVIIPPMKTIPAGKFLMGSDKKKDSQAQGDELQQFPFTLGAYQIGTYPLTVAEYACFVRATKRSEPGDWQNQQQKQDHPVVNVSWNDMLAYTQWLAKVTGQPYRLPTEAEWEKAARGTDGRIYPWGNEWDKTRANTNDGGPGGTTPVGSYPQGASPYGCLDMAGNVWEWTSTIYKPYPYQTGDGRENLTNTQEYRVLRGGSWGYNHGIARAANRYNGRFGDFYNVWGGRLVRDVLAAGS